MKRAPRDWRRYGGSYVTHAAQGLVVGLLLSPRLCVLVLAAGYALYQTIEYARALHTERVQRGAAGPLDDTPSRDVSDFLVGVWAGFAVRWLAVVLGPRRR